MTDCSTSKADPNFYNHGMFKVSQRLFSEVSKFERFVPKSGVFPMGFKAGGIHCGVKKNGKLDLALLHNVSGNDAVASAVFTTNQFKAAPVQVSSRIIKEKKGVVNSLIINSGNANAVTGAKGLQDAENMVKVTDSVLEQEEDSSLVMLTGVIGNLLPIDNILQGIPKLALSETDSDFDHWMKCAEAICTTDTFPKLATGQFEANGKTYTIAGMAKGAGMICPNMATLIGCLATDAPLSKSALDQITKYAVDRSFNCISVDGDMLTNDTIVAIANGAAGGELIDSTSECGEAFLAVREAVTSFAKQLAQLVPRDGEGATKFITIRINDALSYKDAKEVANTIANSSLFKTAMYGCDANWGRILSAIGYANVSADSVNNSKTCVSFVRGDEKLDVLVDGEPQEVDEEYAKNFLDPEDIELSVLLGTGGGQSCEFWTCDLTDEYVHINGDYRS